MYEREAKPFRGRMSLAKLATICAYTIERDVSEHVVRLAYNTRLIGGDELDANMRHLHNVLGTGTMDARYVEDSFLTAWKRAWADNRRRNHGDTVRLITSLMVAMNRETAERAVSDSSRTTASWLRNLWCGVELDIEFYPTPLLRQLAVF